MRRATCLVIIALLLPAPLLAADAHQLFERGSTALAAGKPKEALSAFEAAYKAQPAPSLLFWIAEAHRALKHKASAVKYYRQYLEKLPNGPKKAEAQARLDELTKGRQARKEEHDKLVLQELELPAGPSDVLTLPGEEPAPPATAAAPPPPKAAPPAQPQPAAPPPAKIAAAPPAPKPATPLAQPKPVTGTVSTPLARTETDRFIYLQYTARLLTPSSSMMQYSTTESPKNGTLYTHGIGVGLQTENFKNGGYFGFGTQDGGRFGAGSDTLLRFELSWQFAWVPLGSTRIVSPHLGARVGGMGVKSERLTGGSFKPGIVLAALAGIDLQLQRWLVLTAGAGYDQNLGPDLGPNASISGFSLDARAEVRF